MKYKVGEYYYIPIDIFQTIIKITSIDDNEIFFDIIKKESNTTLYLGSFNLNSNVDRNMENITNIDKLLYV